MTVQSTEIVPDGLLSDRASPVNGHWILGLLTVLLPAFVPANIFSHDPQYRYPKLEVISRSTYSFNTESTMCTPEVTLKYLVTGSSINN